MDADVILAPGTVFSISQSAASFLGFDVAQMDDPRVFSVLSITMTEDP